MSRSEAPSAARRYTVGPPRWRLAAAAVAGLAGGLLAWLGGHGIAAALVLLVAVAAAGMAAFAALDLLRPPAHPRLALELSPSPPAVGDTLRIAWALADRRVPSSAADAVLVCTETVLRDDGDAYTSEARCSATVPLLHLVQGSLERQGVARVRLPAGLPPTFRSRHNGFAWTLRLEVRGAVEEYPLEVLPARRVPAEPPPDRRATPPPPAAEGLVIALDRPSGCYSPGEAVTGTVSWRLRAPPRRVALRLSWKSQGAGDRDGEEVAAVDLGRDQAGSQPFRLGLPMEPCSVDGQLISIGWQLEASAEPALGSARQVLMLGGDGLPAATTRAPAEGRRPGGAPRTAHYLRSRDDGTPRALYRVTEGWPTRWSAGGWVEVDEVERDRLMRQVYLGPEDIDPVAEADLAKVQAALAAAEATARPPGRPG